LVNTAPQDPTQQETRRGPVRGAVPALVSEGSPSTGVPRVAAGALPAHRGLRNCGGATVVTLGVTASCFRSTQRGS
jgi:hypothetical protein